MTNYLEKILDLIQSTPDIKTIQICDRVDLDLDIVENHLKAAVIDGKITVTPVLGANQIKTNSYKINPTHAYWWKKKESVETTVKNEEISKTKKAMNYLAGKGDVHGDELCRAMGMMERTYTPQQYLANQIKNGIVIKTGQYYRLAGKDDPAPKFTTKQKAVKLVKAVKPAKVIPAIAPVAKPEKIAIAAIDAPALPTSAHIPFAIDRLDAIKSCLTPSEYKSFIKGSVIMCMLSNDEGIRTGAALTQHLFITTGEVTL